MVIFILEFHLNKIKLTMSINWYSILMDIIILEINLCYNEKVYVKTCTQNLH